MSKQKWFKKDTKPFVHVGRDELYKKKVLKISIYVHNSAFVEDVDLMDYIEYRLNLDHGTKGLIVLENIEIPEGADEVSNAT